MEVRVKWELDLHFGKAAFNFIEAEKRESERRGLMYMFM